MKNNRIKCIVFIFFWDNLPLVKNCIKSEKNYYNSSIKSKIIKKYALIHNISNSRGQIDENILSFQKQISSHRTGKMKGKKIEKKAGKINKALKIIRDEGFMEFARRLSRRIVYGIVNSIKAGFVMNKHSSRVEAHNKIHFTEKRIMPGIQMRNDGIKMERFFADIKAEILRIKNK